MVAYEVMCLPLNNVLSILRSEMSWMHSLWNFSQIEKERKTRLNYSG